MKRIALLLLCLRLASPAFAFEPPLLEKSDAKRIMESMDWTEVTVVAVRQGVDAQGATAPIYATVVGVGILHGEHHSISQTLFYDRDLDWHFLLLGDKGARVWNKNGYQEIKPWALW
ncbi:MAG: hypothetical protein ABJF10_22035 [Chthoniobacter sp.]|uniref:hypothetical protein n=1 Tax=Chthoniobacter sp. TaxID=2510640 RepID=UPI0032A8B31C